MRRRRDDLPGYRDTQATEALGLVAVETHLVRNGFKVTRVASAFDDGLDLLVSPHDGSNVLPAMAGLQVRAGPSQRGLKVGRHEAYWRDHNLPVFGVVLTDPTPEHPVGGWSDAREYLRRNPRTRTIPTHSAFPGRFAQALLAACDENRSLLSALDLFDSDWRRQATAAAALAPLCTDPRVAQLLGSRRFHQASRLFDMKPELGLAQHVGRPGPEQGLGPPRGLRRPCPTRRAEQLSARPPPAEPGWRHATGVRAYEGSRSSRRTVQEPRSPPTS